jgi:hypothetical protein
MIELDDRVSEDYLTIRLCGSQSISEFLPFADNLARLCGERPNLRILFDWTALDGWDAKSGFASTFRSWKKESLLFERMAILHEHHWNRQAALLAALLRSETRLVRSWASRDRSKAMAWLRETLPSP